MNSVCHQKLYFLWHQKLDFLLLEFIAKQPVPVSLQYVLKQFFGNKTNKDKEYNKIYMRLYRLLKRLQSEGVVELEKCDGLIVIKPTKELVDLILRARKTQTTRGSRKTCDGLCKIPTRCSFQRYNAIRVALSVKMLGDGELEKISRFFGEYLSDCDSKVVVLRRRDDVSGFYPEFVVLPYRNRFNDPRYYRKQLDNVREIFRIASERYRRGVFLTLTTDPKRFSSVYESWRHFSKAFNRFMSYLRKRLGFRPMYIAAYEFTKSGLLHVHVVFFGVDRLLDKYELTRVWMRCGQGMVNYVVAIVNRNGRWVSLYGDGGRRVGDVSGYLSKYLGKALSNSNLLALYFVSGKRFVSWSYRLYRCGGRVSRGIYCFFGVFVEWELPFVVYEYLVESLRVWRLSGGVLRGSRLSESDVRL